MDESGRDPTTFRELHTATDLVLHTTKATAQTVGKAMANTMAKSYRFIRDAEKIAVFDSPVTFKGLFGPAVDGFTERFTEDIANAVISFLSAPNWWLFQAAPRQRPPSSLQNQHNLSTRLSRSLGLNSTPGQLGSTPCWSTKFPPCVVLDPESQKLSWSV